ncbi:MAG TPA: phosphoglycolate phosphatase [Rudaea sp.]|nr:phosphoglycolate phosphatase [Rudaea sp.]
MIPGGDEICMVLFDLDGTLVDSAPDLVAAMQALRAELGESEIDCGGVGRVVSKGGRAMLRQGFPGADDARIEALLPRFLDLYSTSIATHSTLFPGVDHVLSTLEAAHVPWGIVTNKPGWLARSLVSALALDQRCTVLVSGDCLPQRKPDPEPILHACKLAGCNPRQCVYVGDDVRDMEAGRSANTLTVAAAWGYLNGEDALAWGADIVVQSPVELLPVLGIV